MGIVERKSRQKQALRERILDASRRIVMREGFAALSMRKIADAIEYSPATLYLHFASRDEIAQALCAEGYAQLLETFVPLAGIVDPAERLRALGRAYVAFGVAHPETYRLIFMEDPSYTGAALSGGAAAAARTGAPVTANVDASAAVEASVAATTAKAAVGASAAATTAKAATGATAADSPASGKTSLAPAKPDDDPGDAALRIMLSALDELKAAGRLSAVMDVMVWAEAFWATLHGIVALNLTCPVFPSVSLDKVVGVALDAWLGTRNDAGQPAGGTGASRPRTKKSVGAPVEAHVEAGGAATEARTGAGAKGSVKGATKGTVKAGNKGIAKAAAKSTSKAATRTNPKATSKAATRPTPKATSKATKPATKPKASPA